MRALRPYLALALLVFLGVILSTLPATLLLRVLPSRLALEQVSGTLWQGSAAQLRLDGTVLGRLDWQLSPWRLLTLVVAADLQLTRPDGHLEGHLTRASDGTIAAQDLRVDLPLTTLHPEHTGPSWEGRVSGTIRAVRLEQGWPRQLDAQLTMAHLRAPQGHDDLGTFVLLFDPTQATSTALRGQVHDAGGPLAVSGQLLLEQNRSYRLEGFVRARRSVSEELARTLAFLGSPDADGRRPFAISGTF